MQPAEAIPWARVAWACRRGMRELDQILGAFAEAHYATLEPAVQGRFFKLLQQPDPVLYEALVLAHVEILEPCDVPLAQRIISHMGGV